MCYAIVWEVHLWWHDGEEVAPSRFHWCDVLSTNYVLLFKSAFSYQPALFLVLRSIVFQYRSLEGWQHQMRIRRGLAQTRQIGFSSAFCNRNFLRALVSQFDTYMEYDVPEPFLQPHSNSWTSACAMCNKNYCTRQHYQVWNTTTPAVLETKAIDPSMTRTLASARQVFGRIGAHLKGVQYVAVILLHTYSGSGT